MAELVRRYLDAMTPPIRIGFGGLRKYVDRQGLLKVFVLSAREDKLLIEPGEDGLEGMFKPTAQIWVDANLVRFDQSVIPQTRGGESTEQSLRLNKAAPTGDPKESK